MADKLQIVYRDAATLKPYERNARTHSADQIAQIGRSIQEFGWTNPILVDEAGSIIAGHWRLAAAQQIGIDKVPTICVAGLTDAQRRALVIADNKLALNAGWDEGVLLAEIEALAIEDFDLSLLGFDEDDIQALKPLQANPGKTDQDDSPPVQPDAITRPGDMWVCGAHRLLCGDSTSIEALERLTCGGVDMWLTDPPYNVAYEGKTKEALKIKNDAMADDAFRQFLRDAYVAADAVMKAGAVFYIWHADHEGYNFRGAAKDAGWVVRQCLVWKKQTLVLGRHDYHWKHEPCLYGWKGGASHLWAADRSQTTILEFDRPSRNCEHPTMKPVALFEYLMLNNTKVGDKVLDSFGGSGTTMIAAEKNGRVACLMELEPRYCDVIVKRWQAFTGKAATLESDGRTFDELAAAVEPQTEPA